MRCSDLVLHDHIYEIDVQPVAHVWVPQPTWCPSKYTGVKALVSWCGQCCKIAVYVVPIFYVVPVSKYRACLIEIHHQKK
jgi:hypothetical protein